jgi:hypothetical protein
LESINADLKINLSEKDWQIIDKINLNEPLSSFAKVTRGIEFGGNHESIQNEKSRESLPIIVGGSIAKYSIKEIKGYAPFVKDEQSKYKTFELYSIPRILIQRIRNLSLKDRIVATYTAETILSTNTLRILLPKDNIDLKALLGKINSKLINYYFKLNFNNKDIYGYQLESIPIAFEQGLDSKISKNANRILEIKQADSSADTIALETQIDQLVYQLYGLTEEEIEIIENSVK